MKDTRLCTGQDQRKAVGRPAWHRFCRTARQARTAMLALVLIAGLLAQPLPVLAMESLGGNVSTQAENRASAVMDYLMTKVPEPVPASVGGEWTVIGVSRQAGASNEAFATRQRGYLERYRVNAIKQIQEVQGKLSTSRYTEYARLVLAITALGRSPADFGGYDLLKPLSDMTAVMKQGVNGAIYALIAFDSGNYRVPAVPAGGTQVTREKLIAAILRQEIPTGGFAMSGAEMDADVTAMALQALAPYQKKTEVATATQRALTTLAAKQTAAGSIEQGATENCESTAQAILALTALGIDPETDSRFVKPNGANTVGLISGLGRFRGEDGSFRHVASGSSDLMATEQALLALIAYDRFRAGKSALFAMTDVARVPAEPGSEYSCKVMLNGRYLTFDQPPVSRNARVMVPMRAIFEALGAEVRWDGVKRTATATLGGRAIELTVGSATAKLNNQVVTLDAAPIIVNGRTLVPIRFVAEGLQATVNWSGDTGTVIILK